LDTISSFKNHSFEFPTKENNLRFQVDLIRMLTSDFHISTLKQPHDFNLLTEICEELDWAEILPAHNQIDFHLKSLMEVQSSHKQRGRLGQQTLEFTKLCFNHKKAGFEN